MLEIKQAVAVITGAGGGIGEALAKYWVGQGGKVVLADVSATGLRRVAAEIQDLGGQVVTSPATSPAKPIAPGWPTPPSRPTAR